MHRYKGKEISKRKANLMVAGAILGMVGAVVGLWLTASLIIGLFR